MKAWAGARQEEPAPKPPAQYQSVAAAGSCAVTCPSWDDAIAVLPGECLALVNIERQVRARMTSRGPNEPAGSINRPDGVE